MPIHAKCPICGSLERMPTYPKKDGFTCNKCGYVFFRSERWVNRDIRWGKAIANQ